VKKSIFFTENSYMTFYDRVKKQVKKNTSLTLESFIQSLNINYGTYQTQRKANNLPRADEALKIAQALNTSVEYLVSGTEPENSKAAVLDDLQTFIDTYRREIKREAAIQMIIKQIGNVAKLQKYYQDLRKNHPQIKFSKEVEEFFSSEEDTTGQAPDGSNG
jgi:transcriptional regulator with XRE-family HTH domain